MSNHIDHIEITNFKSIRHAKIEGCKRINVFIGYPNVGKSAILEAISTLTYFGGSTESFYKLCRVKFANELFYNANIKENAIVIAGHFKCEIEYVTESCFDLTIYLAQNDVWEQIYWIRYTAGKAGEFSSDLEDELHELEMHEENEKYYNNDDIDRIGPEIERRLQRVVKKYAFKGSYNKSKTDAQNLLTPYGENLVDIIQFNKELRKEVGELFKEYNLKLLIDQATNSIRGLKQLDEETIFTVPFYQMADTLQRLIFHKAAIMSNENTVLLFEEPEAHMFPPYIKKFTGDVIFNKDNGNQYFISTHSPFVLDDLIADAKDDLSVFLVDLKNGETIIKRLSDNELNEVQEYGVDLFYNIQSYLD